MSYKLKFKCEELTGDSIHSIDIDDTSLTDTWDCVKVGDVPKEIQKFTNKTHDVNIWCDTNDNGINELYMTLYPLYYDADVDTKFLQADIANGISCKIVEVISPKVLRVPIRAWYKERYGAKWDYQEYFNGNKEIPRPNETKFDVGDVVVINDYEDDICIGVVLGVIDNVCGELRTDARGMVSFDQIRHATLDEVKSHEDCSDILKYLK